GYPFLFEPWIPTRVQALGWSVGYIAFVVLCSAAAWISLRRLHGVSSITIDATSSTTEATSGGEAPPTAARQVLWCVLAATGSLLLLAVSNHISQNVAAVPLLWVVPLAIYLLTFVLCF